MKLEQQVVSLELAQKMKSLGAPQESLFWWVEQQDGTYKLLSEQSRLIAFKEIINDYPDAEPIWSAYISAYTVAELGELLPAHLQIDKYQSSPFLWSVHWTDMKREKHTEKADTETDARAKMLIYLVENKLWSFGQK